MRRPLLACPQLLSAVGALLTTGVLLLPAGALAASVSDLGAGFPTSMNASDHVVIATLVFEENEGKLEENIEGPWSIWSPGKVTHLQPLNGEPTGESESLGHEHKLEIANINESGQAGGSSTVGYTAGKEERSVYNPVWFSPEGVPHRVPLLQEEVFNEEGEGRPAGGLGYGIDNAGDVAGIGVEQATEGEKKVVFGRGFFAPGGLNPTVVGEADKPASGPWLSEVFEINDAGTMLGSVAPENPETHEPGKPKFYLWTSASGAGTLLNFESPIAGLGLASDGSILGIRGGKTYLRTPEGKETEVAGLSKVFASNSAHEVTGSKTVAGAEHAAVWRAGTVTDLNTLLPGGSGWVLQRASAINDNGDIAGVGTHEGATHVFLLKPGLVVTSAKDTKESTKAGAGVCATEEGGCTLRAAIETVNADKHATPTAVTFNVPGSKPAEITPASPLPAITSPIKLEGATQPGAAKEGASEEGRVVGVILDGTKAAGAPGLELDTGAGESTVSGMAVQRFAGGDGVLLKGEHQQVADSILYGDKVGVEVAGSNDTIGAVEELAGNDFVQDGDTPGLGSYIRGLGQSKTTPAAYDAAVASYGAAVLLSRGATSGTQIQGNLIGIPGGLRSLTPSEEVSTFGVLIDPAGEGLANVSIGGAGAARNVISGDFTGVAVLASRGGAAAGVTIVGNQIGGDRTHSSEAEVGTLIGVMAEGRASGLQVGNSSQGNTFPTDVIGVLLAGEELTGASVQGNTLGVDAGLRSFEKGLRGHDILGIVAADTRGAQIGGAPGQGNKILGAPLGIVLAGEHSFANRVESNTIGRAAPPAGPFDLSEKSFEVGEFGGILGLAALGGGEQQIGSAGAGNTIQGNLFGVFSVESNDDSVQGNAFVKNAFGLFDLGSGGIGFGGSAAGQGNQVASNALGVFMANANPTKQELEDAQASERSASSAIRRETLKETPSETEALDDVDGTTTADLLQQTFEAPSPPGTNNRIEGNTFGTEAAGNTKNAAGETLGNTASALIAGDEQVLVGGTAPGQGNKIVNGGSGGVLVAGTTAHPPSVQVLGNTIYNNSTFGGLLVGVPGLGINLVGEEGSAFGLLGVDPQDPTQPDGGPNGLQNSPLLTSATTVAGKLTVTGTLQSAPNTSYTIELFADQFQNPYGAGEGQQILGRLNLQTNGSGQASFSAEMPAAEASARYVSATATTLPGSGQAGVTSEFSVDAKIEPGSATTTTPSTPATPASPPAPGSPAPAVPSTGVVVHSGTLTATVSAVKFTLPGVSVSCASAASSGCTATATATEAGAATESRANASTAAAHRKAKRPPVILARWSARLSAGTISKVALTLTSQGQKLLARKHSLLLSVTLSVKAGTGRATTKKLRVRVALKRASHKKR
jgi:hypothetical protein